MTIKSTLATAALAATVVLGFAAAANAATTEESTPPDMATTIRLPARFPPFATGNWNKLAGSASAGGRRLDRGWAKGRLAGMACAIHARGRAGKRRRGEVPRRGRR